MAKVRVDVDEQVAATMHALVQQMRGHEQTQHDEAFDSRLRDVELALAGALRSVG